MKTIINITVEKNGGGGKCLQKEFDLQVLLVPGVEIEDSAWEDAKRIETVSVEPNEPYALAGVEMVSLPDNEFDQYVEMLKSHGWS